MQPETPRDQYTQFPIPPARRRIWPWIAGGAAALVLAVIVTAAVTIAATSGEERPAGAGTPDAETVATATPAASVLTPTLQQFELSVRIKEKQCFGSAGCSVTFVVEVALNTPLPEGATWEVTYEVTGPDDGPIIGTFEITGDQYQQREEIAQTRRSSTRLTVRPTAIVRVGF